jgi:uracil-DNA glycosylase family 4
MSSKYQLHVQTWKACTRCSLSENRRKVVLCRGKLPCDVLFLGEAPGQSEDVLGIPFIGPAGKLLDSIIQQAHSKTYEPLQSSQLRLAFTNLVSCIPVKGGGQGTTEPTDSEIRSCSPRLNELMDLANPKLVICVGKLAREYAPLVLDTIKEGRAWASIAHPASILRADKYIQSRAIQQCVEAIAYNLDDVFFVPF